MQIEQLTKYSEPFQKLRARFGTLSTDLNPQIIFHITDLSMGYFIRDYTDIWQILIKVGKVWKCKISYV